MPSDDEDKALKEDESKYVCVYEISSQPSRTKARNYQILVSHMTIRCFYVSRIILNRIFSGFRPLIRENRNFTSDSGQLYKPYSLKYTGPC